MAKNNQRILTNQEIHELLEKGALKSKKYGDIQATWHLLIDDILRPQDNIPYQRAIGHLGHLILWGGSATNSRLNKYTDVWALKPFAYRNVEKIAYTIACKSQVRDRLPDMEHGQTFVQTKTDIMKTEEEISPELILFDISRNIINSINTTHRRASMLYEALKNEQPPKQ